MNKKQFFLQYGIEYSKGKILAPWGKWVPQLLTYGSKTHCFGWSTLAGTKDWTVNLNGEQIVLKGTCPLQCKGCYGCSGRYAMQSVIDGNGWRTYAIMHFPDWTRRAITAQINWGIRGVPLPFVRVHITGDFFANWYIEVWKRIKADCPNTRMWAYTKNEDAENAFDDVAGFNIVKSLVPGFGLNYGHCDHVMNIYRALIASGIETHICRCAVDKEQHCNTCRACQDLKHVLFLEHGTDYKPECDPLWNEFVALVESDENKRHI